MSEREAFLAGYRLVLKDFGHEGFGSDGTEEMLDYLATKPKNVVYLVWHDKDLDVDAIFDNAGNAEKYAALDTWRKVEVYNVSRTAQKV